VLGIRPKRRVADGSELSLEVRDGHGRLVDEFRFPVGAERAEPSLPTVRASPIRIEEESSLATRSVRIVNEVFDLAFAVQEPAYYDHGGGHLRRCAAFGQPLMLEAPQVHVLPTRSPTEALPDRLAWEVRSMQSERRGRNAGMRIAGTYGLLDAEYDWTISPSGGIVIAAHATWKGDDLPAREIGLRFSMPLSCGILRWSRKAEWRVYPEDHIGRPRGRARAAIAHPHGLPPSWPWAHDATSMGTNDFRSTKRRIRWAAVGSDGGPGVLIRSDGSQHVRAMLESDRVAVHVLDWYGGTNTRMSEWTQNYGEGRLLRRGEAIECVVRLAFVPDIDRL
jgi:hypothetical protein